ncbi:PREDICTED: apolipoprotein L6 [Condylura cristata]|uniref:apolipoprotein L6 n=1 Tax=Condylura cristata TaxID=143302 RepID=UPI0003345F39|nr:PREDICTED: apolipoprotein L6 [Condylura cristata]
MAALRLRYPICKTGITYIYFPETHLAERDASHSSRDRASADLLPRELLDGQTGKGRAAGVGCPRGKEDVLGEDVEKGDGELSAEERAFLEEYPFLKEELEEGIRKLHALADQLDTTHRALTKTSVLAGSIAVVSGTMSILGLVLAPATAGGSLMLSAASKGLETAAGVTSILTSVWEHVHSQGARAQASSLVPTRGPEAREAGERGVSYMTAASQLVYNYGSTLKEIQKHVRALQAARAQPHLVAAARRLQATGHLSAWKRRQVHGAFQGTPLLMTRSARWLGSVMTGLSLSLDLTVLLKDWKHLKEGARTELAEELRAQAQELEGQLRELAQLLESLQQKLLPPKRPMSSSSEEATGTVPPAPAQLGEAGRQVAGEPTGGQSPGPREG